MSKAISYIQLYNSQHDPVYMEMQSGKLSWILPSSDYLQYVAFVSHVADNGKFYYENTSTNEVAWVLPKEKMSFQAADLAELVIKINRKTTESRIGIKYDDTKTTNQMLALDNYLMYKDSLKAGGAVTNNDEDDEGPIYSSKPFSSFGGGYGDESSEESERPSRMVALKTVDQIKRSTIKSGYLMKLATVSGRNWKKRFFAVTQNYIAYYADESSLTNSKPKGELQIYPDATVIEEKVDKKYGYGFKYTNSVENIVLAATTEIDRSHWIQTIQTLINESKNYLRAFLTIQPGSTVLTNSNQKNVFGSNGKVPVRRFCILTDELLTIHPDKQVTTAIEGVININENTKIESMDDSNLMISLVDSDIKASKIIIQFNSGIEDERYYNLWKEKLSKLIRGDQFENRARASKRESGAGKTAQRRTSKPPTGDGPPSNSVPIPSGPPKTEIPNNISVFGLSLDDDEDDDDDSGAAYLSNINSGSTASTNVPFANTASAAKPAATASSTTPSASSKPKIKGKSYLKMRKAQERTSLTDTNKALENELASLRIDAEQEGEGEDDEDYDIGSAANVTKKPFSSSAEPSQPQQAQSNPLLAKANPQEVNASHMPGAIALPTLASANVGNPLNGTANPAAAAVNNPPAEGGFNPIARRKSLLGSAAMTQPSDSLFIQSLRAKSELQGGTGSASPSVVDSSEPQFKPSPPPPPPMSIKKPVDSSGDGNNADYGDDPFQPISNYSPLPNANPSSSSSNVPVAAAAPTVNIFQPGRRNSFMNKTVPPPPPPPKAQSAISSASPDFGGSNNNSNSFLMPREDEEEEEEEEEEELTFPSMIPSNGLTKKSLLDEKIQNYQQQKRTILSDQSLSEYLNTPIELRTSEQLDYIFSKPTEEFLIHTNSILLDCQQTMKNILQENSHLIPYLTGKNSKKGSKHSSGSGGGGSKAVKDQIYKSTFSLEKIESYLQHSSIFANTTATIAATASIGSGSGGASGGDASSKELARSYSQLLQEKEIILNLLQFMKISEENMISSIKTYEYEALERIENEISFYKNELLSIENEIKEIYEENNQEIQNKLQIMNKTKYLISEKYLEMNLSYEENIHYLIDITRDINKQNNILQNERKKMLKQRYQLDLMLQELNSVSSSSGFAANGVNGATGNGYLSQSHGSPNLPHGGGDPYGNNSHLYPPNAMMNNGYPPQNPQLGGYPPASYPGGGYGNPSPYDPPGAYYNQPGPGRAPNGAPYYDPYASNGQHPTSPGLHRSQGPIGNNGVLPRSRSVSPAATMNRGQQAYPGQGASHYANGNRGMPANNNMPIYPPLPDADDDGPEDDYAQQQQRLGRSRQQVAGNVNRSRSRSPASTIQSTPSLRHMAPNNKQQQLQLQLQQQQMLQQQQQLPAQALLGGGGPMASSNGRAMNASAYGAGSGMNGGYPSAMSQMNPPHMNNIQVSLEQLKKQNTVQNNSARKPFR